MSNYLGSAFSDARKLPGSTTPNIPTPVITKDEAFYKQLEQFRQMMNSLPQQPNYDNNPF
jgi:hypothetical protein